MHTLSKRVLLAFFVGLFLSLFSYNATEGGSSAAATIGKSPVSQDVAWLRCNFVKPKKDLNKG